MNTSVLVNGKEVKQWSYGYTNFYVELGKYLNYGQKNIITVIADNSQTPNTRWYSGSGIYREVYLYVVSGSILQFWRNKNGFFLFGHRKINEAMIGSALRKK